MLRYVTLRYVTLRYVNHSFKLSRIFYCKNILKTFITRHYEGNARSNPKSKEFYRNLIASLLSVARNDNFNYIHAFSYALKNQFEIISRNENYAFNHNNFYHNGNNRIWRLPLLLAKGTPTETKSRNDDFIVCNNGLLSINNGLFSRNDYGGNFIFGFWSNSNFGFLFNRKINSKKNLFQKEKKR